MKNFVVVERKHGVSIHIEDTAAMTREVVNLTWKEMAGLHWAIQDTIKHPSFQAREPREREHKGGVQREFTKHIHLIEED